MRGKRRALLGRVVLPACLIFFLIVSVFHKNSRTEKQVGRPSKKAVIFDAAHFPLQSELLTAEPITFVKPGISWRIYPRAGYQIAARVLQSKKYDDWQADISPVDLALGWGIMSDPGVDRWVEVRQEDRWYFYRKQEDAPLTLEDIRNSSANVHIIPANDSVAAVIEGLRPNDMILMEGKLVDVEVDKLGQLIQFQTSLTRSDSDDNSCEIFYVERVFLGADEIQ